MAQEHRFLKPSLAERVLNRAFGFLVGIGLGASYNYLLQVRGRKSGKLYSMPINLLELDGKKYLVAPRGRTQWVRNAEATGEITLKKGSNRDRYGLRPLSGDGKTRGTQGVSRQIQRRSAAVLSGAGRLASAGI